MRTSADTRVGVDARSTHVEALRGIGRLFHARGWSLGTSSNYSVVVNRDPLQLLITASGRDKDRLAADDFTMVDGEGRAIDTAALRPSAETPLHAVLARRADVAAVLHTHSVAATVLSDVHFPTGAVSISGFEMLKGLSGITSHETSVAIPILDNSQDMPAMARTVAQRFGAGTREHAFLVRGHGLYTWGCDLDEARRHVEILEFLFEVVITRARYTAAVAPNR